MCSTTQFMVHHIPVVLHGDSSEKLFLYIHGKMGRKEEAARIAEIVCPKGYQVLGIDLPGHGERTGEMERFVPWEVVPELRAVYDYAQEHWNYVSLYANSIGAYFSLLAFREDKIEKSLFVSPVLDMEKLIGNMMGWANVAEDDLREKETIETAFGETLSWEYLCYVRSHPLSWTVPTEILYGGQDNLTDRETITSFANAHQAGLTVMENGEHWFHTLEQMEYLDTWIIRCENAERESV